MFALAVIALLSGAPTDPAVPTRMQGTCGKHGRCDLLTERLTIRSHSAGWGKGPFEKVYFDNANGTPVIFWSEEGVVDNFVMGRNSNILIHNPQGFDMPGEEGYARCGHMWKRLAWPPR
jgi:hypothetical protein